MYYDYVAPIHAEILCSCYTIFCIVKYLYYININVMCAAVLAIFYSFFIFLILKFGKSFFFFKYLSVYLLMMTFFFFIFTWKQEENEICRKFCTFTSKIYV